MPNLNALANYFQSDKGSIVSFAHKYTYLYDLIFWPYRDRDINFLELGLAVGGPETAGGRTERRVGSPSVAMWLEYFRCAHIYGFDISDFSHIEHDRFSFTRGDMGAEADLSRLADVAPHFDIIIDDASHASYHQQLAFKTLWKRLAPGGLYVIEDLHWQSPVFEAAMPQVPLSRDFFPDWLEKGQYRPNVLFSEESLEKLTAEIDTFSAFPAFNASHTASHSLTDGSAKLIVLRKRSDM